MSINFEARLDDLFASEINAEISWPLVRQD